MLDRNRSNGGHNVITCGRLRCRDSIGCRTIERRTKARVFNAGLKVKLERC
jgi:hypothetical protein